MNNFFIIILQITTLSSRDFQEFLDKINSRFGEGNGNSSPSTFLSYFLTEERQRKSQPELGTTFDENLFFESDALAYPETAR